MVKTLYVILINDMCIEESIKGAYNSPRAIERVQDYPVGSVVITGVVKEALYYVSFMYEGELDLFKGTYKACEAFIEDEREAAAIREAAEAEQEAKNPLETILTDESYINLIDFTPQSFS